MKQVETDIMDAKYRKAINHTHSVVVVDKEAKFIFANDRYCKIYSFQKELICTEGFNNRLEPESRQIFKDKFDLGISERKIFKAKLKKKNYTGSTSTVEVTGVPFFGQNGEIDEVMLLISDTTSDEMQRRKRELELFKQRRSMIEQTQSQKAQIDQLTVSLALAQSELEKQRAETKSKQAKLDLLAIKLQEAKFSLNLENALAAEIHRAKRYKRPISIVLLGVDRLEGFRTLGEHVFERIVLSFHSLVKEFVRLCDFLFLEENDHDFFMILPETPKGGAKRLCEKVQEQISRKMQTVEGRKITASFVIVEFGPDTQDHAQMIQKARSTYRELCLEMTKRGVIVEL